MWWFKKKKIDQPQIDFSFIKEWDKPQYSYVICISDDLKKKAGLERHNALIFSCVKSIEKYSELVKNGKATISIIDYGQPIIYTKKTFVIDDYVLFLVNPDFIFNDTSIYSVLQNIIDHLIIKFDGSEIEFLYNEFSYDRYEKIAGKEYADKIFFKTQKTRFNSLEFDTIFIYQQKMYIKCPVVFEGCCSPKLNAISKFYPEDYLYLNNNVEVEKVL